MLITFKGTLVDKTGKALASKSMRGCYFDKNGKVTVIASGKTSANGSFLIRAKKSLGDTHIPRVLVQFAHKSKWTTLTEEPRTCRSGNLDFGKIVFHEKALYKVGSTSYFGDNKTVTTTTPLLIHRMEQPIHLSPQLIAATAKPAEIQATTFKKMNADFAKLQKDKQTIDVDRVRLQKLIATKENTLKAKDNELKLIKVNLLKEKQDISKGFTSKLKTKDLEIEELKKKLIAKPKVPRASSPKDNVSIDDLTFQTGTQIASAQQKLAAQKSTLRLSKVSLQLRGIGDATDRLEKLNMDFVTQNPHAKPQPPVEKQVAKEKSLIPDLNSLPEKRAQLVLNDRDIPYRVYYQSLDQKQASKLGRVIHQSPAAGSELSESTVLKVIIGKSSSI